MSDKPVTTKCCCPSPDALRCMQIRYPILDCIGEEDRSEQNDIERCECCCHAEDEDEE